MNGTKVTNGLRCAISHVPATTYWILGRSVARLQGTVGIDDSSDTGAKAKVTITADGKPLLDQDIAYGQSANLDADITGVLRLEVTVTDASTSKKSGTSGTTYVVLANAVVLGSAAAIAALGGTP
ncbi:NPCBM/NEW2 domain-containing protein [Arthrobacter sp. 24S4-2]|uniref:NPCBM/NEW2 domain-containing protein n=1 Tax=Arthrobacter sp. 24S4-2 TaxID=2575374 RepID=UPI0020C802F3|nr:NPCBM/NEW2 domain-containing protein [Arthrobacter sp. 24S4-2]